MPYRQNDMQQLLALSTMSAAALSAILLWPAILMLDGYNRLATISSGSTKPGAESSKG
jgi:hypothetical protein